MQPGECRIVTALSLAELNDLARRIAADYELVLLRPAVERIEGRRYRIRPIYVPRAGVWLANLLLQEIDYGVAADERG